MKYGYKEVRKVSSMDIQHLCIMKKKKKKKMVYSWKQ